MMQNDEATHRAEIEAAVSEILRAYGNVIGRQQAENIARAAIGAARDVRKSQGKT